VETESSMISLLVAISEGTSCSRSEQYRIHVDVSNETDVVSSMVVVFSTQVTYITIPAGMYRCTASVSEGGGMVDSTSIPCQSKGKSYCLIVDGLEECMCIGDYNVMC
jgi:hypothetical protein